MCATQPMRLAALPAALRSALARFLSPDDAARLRAFGGALSGELVCAAEAGGADFVYAAAALRAFLVDERPPHTLADAALLFARRRFLGRRHLAHMARRLASPDAGWLRLRAERGQSPTALRLTVGAARRPRLNGVCGFELEWYDDWLYDQPRPHATARDRTRRVTYRSSHVVASPRREEPPIDDDAADARDAGPIAGRDPLDAPFYAALARAVARIGVDGVVVDTHSDGLLIWRSRAMPTPPRTANNRRARRLAQRTALLHVWIALLVVFGDEALELRGNANNALTTEQRAELGQWIAPARIASEEPVTPIDFGDLGDDLDRSGGGGDDDGDGAAATTDFEVASDSDDDDDDGERKTSGDYEAAGGADTFETT
jgi:hypothetical protein